MYLLEIIESKLNLTFSIKIYMYIIWSILNITNYIAKKYEHFCKFMNKFK